MDPSGKEAANINIQVLPQYISTRNEVQRYSEEIKKRKELRVYLIMLGEKRTGNSRETREIMVTGFIYTSFEVYAF